MYEYNFPISKKKITKPSNRQAQGFELLGMAEDLCAVLFKQSGDEKQLEAIFEVSSACEKLLRSYDFGQVATRYHEFLRKHVDEWEEDL